MKNAFMFYSALTQLVFPAGRDGIVIVHNDRDVAFCSENLTKRSNSTRLKCDRYVTCWAIARLLA